MNMSTVNRRLAGRLSAAAALSLLAIGASPAGASLQLSQVPLFLPEALPPRVMLVLSKDHEMFKEAYPDYSDLNNDGVINNTYTDSFRYYGYFNSGTCYTYSGGRFQPASAGAGPNGHHCSGQWSGNFLNWATMTRMDVVRRVLYGGYRHIDTESQTVLQREMIPSSSHAFVKIFSGAGSTSVSDVTPYSSQVSMCNVTWPDPLNQRSDQVDTSANPPLLRVAQGDWPIWAATERRQCAWREERDNSSPATAHPRRDGDQLATLNVRVEVCSDTLPEDNCREYSSGSRKPIGLLQRYGEDDRIHFGLLTGSYARNTSGGVLRRNIGPLIGNEDDREQENEVDPDTGIFINTQPGRQSIVNAINRLRMAGWGFSTNTFDDNCRSDQGTPWGILDINDGQCSSWGNPIGEMVLESLRYFAGASGPAFDADDSSMISGMPRATEWRDPLPSEQFCANSNMLVLSSGVSTHDAGSAGSYSAASDIPGLGGSSGVATRTNEVGAGEGLSGTFILGGGNRQCTAETLSGLSAAQGVCPDGPSMLGGYNVAGLAYHAWTRDIRTDYPDQRQHVKTFAVNLSEPLPRLRFGGMEFLPTCQSRRNSTAPWATCAAVQTDVLSATYGSGGELQSAQLRIFWEDSTYGSDYDMDGIVDMTLCQGAACDGDTLANEVEVTVEVMAAYAGFDLRFGVFATGTDGDGLSEWVNRFGGNFSVIDGDNPDRQPDPRTFDYRPGTSAATLLRDPLWYAAKWGGFDKDFGSTPAMTEQWDRRGDGNPDNYYLVRDPARLEADLEQVFSDITQAVSSASAIATNSTQLSTETILYQARFNSEDWTGELLGFGVEADGSVGNLLWNAGDRIPAPNERRIFTRTPDGDGVRFRWDDLPESYQVALDRNPQTNVADGNGEGRLQWLRGVRSGEQQAGGQFRDRSSVLADIVNSNPVFVSVQNFGYEGLPSSLAPRYPDPQTEAETNGYNAFRRGRLDSDGRPLQPTVFVGANGGMLHAFNAENGNERFAYVPSSLISRLNRLPDPDYVHRYYVDGQIFVGDAYIDSEWRTILVGSTGAGSRTIFALDVTDPQNFSEEDVLWEITHETPGFEQLGYSLGEPVIAPMANGQWAAVFGNGYNSQDQRGSLFVVDLENGELIRRLDSEQGDGSNPNGMATPSLLPRGDRVIQAAYVGDLLGNLWKFDVSRSSSSQWESAYRSGQTPVPLFVARDAEDNRQPITSAIELGRHPEGGFMAYFGTGRYFTTTDNIVGEDPPVQTFYGIWDREGSGSGTGPITNGRSALHEHRILAESFEENFEVRVTTDVEPDWAFQRGWYLDLVSPVRGREGERVVSDPILRAGRIIFTTLIPSPSPCDSGGSSWLMEMDGVTGGRLSYSPFDINEDGMVDDADYVTVEVDGELITVPVSGVRSREGIIQTPAIISAGAVEYKMASGTSGEVEVFRERGAFNRARGSWRQLR